MNLDIKAKWLAALRSGEYKQIRGTLAKGSVYNVNGFCCLGVLCDIAVKEGAIPPAEGRTEGVLAYGEAGQINTLPLEVTLWAGLTSGNPSVGEINRPLGWHNDTGQKDFNEIADLIDRYL